MLEQLNKISVKYAIAFIGVALSLIAVVTVDFLLVNTVKERMTEFSSTFNNATSNVLNADRDLYQAHVAILEYLGEEPGTTSAKAQLDDYRENAQQAYDRMQNFQQLLADYPSITAKLNGFEQLYTDWRSQTDQVISLHDNGRRDDADVHFEGPMSQAFGALRNVYDIGGEAVADKTQALEAATLEKVQAQQYAVTLFTLVVAIVAIAIALGGPLMMSRAIRQITHRIKEIAEGDGDLTARIQSKRRDEIGELASQFNVFVTRIDRTLQAVRASTHSVQHASDEIAKGSQDLASRSQQAASNLQETSASMEEITSTVSNTADAAQQANQLVQSTSNVAHEGQLAMSQVEQTMDDISASSAQIKDIIALIDGIAFQTNILALNASVEAARAGEHGRGFAVVAQEVRTLAGRSSDASQSIRELIDTSVTRTQFGADLVKRTGKTMEEIVKSISRVTDVIGDISAGAKEQSLGIGQVNTAVSELDAMTQQNASMVEQTNAAASGMQEQAERLNELLASFRLGNDLSESLPSPSATGAGTTHASAQTSHAQTSHAQAAPARTTRTSSPTPSRAPAEEWEEF
ncbi:methyl-accepting chemotaxis protein [Halomonas sp. I5-271120]|uniref:methyl-accepting chemotaxis protein n=1 Tax=Halomonas sp. I5-271120 TaxID=3061632 RepID=UPI0027153340|nr:methyl-accepting chemotaxis protein [Halomonas sp. I5-271120]